jgi:hypothetical protein
MKTFLTLALLFLALTIGGCQTYQKNLTDEQKWEWWIWQQKEGKIINVYP